MNAIEQCFAIEEQEEHEANVRRESEWSALYRQFRTEIFPRFQHGPRIVYGETFRQWIDMGMMYAQDGDRSFRPFYGLTDAAYEVRGLRQFQAAVRAYRAQQERIRREMKVF